MTKAALLAFLTAAVGVGCSSPTEKSGTFSLTWTLTQNGAPVSCVTVGAVTLEVTTTPIGGAVRLPTLFDCSALAGTSDQLPTGDYQFELRLLDASRRQVNVITVVATIINAADVHLGNFEFAF